MKKSTFFSLFTFHFSLFTATAALAAASPFVLNPYTFVGRITDARGSAFDADRKATLYARDRSSNLLARSSTFRRDDTPNNYALIVPMSSVASSSAAVTNQLLDVSVLDDLGKTWNAVIDPARVGAPGTVSTVDIALVEDLDGDGIDDDLYRELEAIWMNTQDDPSSTPYSPSTSMPSLPHIFPVAFETLFIYMLYSISCYSVPF